MKRSFLDRFPLARLDAWLGAALVLFLVGLILAASMAAIQTDATDYYAIVQRLIGDEPPIAPNLPLVEQRSPGYPLLSLPALGWASLALIALIAQRVPVMYSCVGQGGQVIGGVTFTCRPDMPAMLNLIRFDANRYVTPLVPFAVLGLRGLLGQITHLFRRQP